MPDQLTPAQQRLKAWLLENYESRHGQSLPDIAPDEDIIESRILDSLSLMNFLCVLEEIVEDEIPIATVNVDNLRTLERISATYLSSERETV